jgi:methionine-gamma-lyase
MGAINAAVLSLVNAGDHIITQQVLYGSCDHFFSEHLTDYNITNSRIRELNAELLEAEFAKYPNTKVVYIETPANPTMTIIDIARTAKIAHAHGAKVVADNTFASPILQQPLALGADVVVHSTTKYINGHGTVIGGVVVSADPEYMENGPGKKLRYMGGAVPSPFDCWLTNIGLKTLPLRMEKHCANAREVAEFLDAHNSVTQTYWPGLAHHPNHEIAAKQMKDFGAMISFDLGNYEAAQRFMDGLKMCSLGVSLGNVDTLVQHPASMTHRVVSDEDKAASGITLGMIRISIGIEDAGDIISDLRNALENI